jgi:molybdopterin converting factor subunit 1
MRVKVLFFASARELTGETDIHLDLQPGATTGEIPELLMSIYPDLDMKRDRMSIAVNKVYCREPTELKEGDIIAILPPISGG